MSDEHKEQIPIEQLVRELDQRNAVDELARRGIKVTMRGTASGWTGTVGGRYDFKADSLGELFQKIAEA